MFTFGQKRGEEKVRPTVGLFEFDQIIHYLIENKGRFRCKNPETFATKLILGLIQLQNLEKSQPATGRFNQINSNQIEPRDV